jgi:GR25 family glycosyltransferase involved in LPS biosynthesis
MDRRPDRLKSFIQEMAKHNITGYERFSAVDGNKLLPNDDLKRLFSNNTFGWRKGIMGCILSHYLMWKELVNSDYTYYLVLEDDIILSNNFDQSLDLIKSMITSCTYPFIYLGYSYDPKLERNICIGPNLVISTLINQSVMWGGTFAYIIHRDTALKFVTEIETNGIKDPIDVFIMGHTGLHETIPQLVKSPVMVVYTDTDSDIQYDLVNMFDNYFFVKYMDSIGGDIEGVGRRSLEELIKIADDNPSCVAFNSYGYLKDEITAPKDFVRLQGAPMSKDGVFVKMVKTDEYDFYPSLNSEGGTISKLDTNSIDVIKQIAAANNNCVAFNTLGELKSKVSDPKDFVLLNPKSGMVTANVKAGLYVKKIGIKVHISVTGEVSVN